MKMTERETFEIDDQMIENLTKEGMCLKEICYGLNFVCLQIPIKTYSFTHILTLGLKIKSNKTFKFNIKNRFEYNLKVSK